MITTALLFVGIGFVAPCYYNSDCMSFDCDGDNAFCDKGSCACLESCEEGDCLTYIQGCQTYDISMQHNYQQYCPNDQCQCPTGYGGPVHGGMGHCGRSSDCYSTVHGCVIDDIHCVDGRCLCLQSPQITTPKPACHLVRDCYASALSRTCPYSSIHCLDGRCECLSTGVATAGPPASHTACHATSECVIHSPCTHLTEVCLSGVCVCL